MTDEHAEIAHALRSLAQARGPAKTFCPSEVARSLGGRKWRARLPAIRAVAAALIDNGELRCTQRGLPVDPETAVGPIRLVLPPR